MAYLVDFGCYVPETRMNNAGLARELGCTEEWIISSCGIEERRIAGDGETVAVMGAHAALDCLKRAGMEAAEIGLLLVSSGSSAMRFPGPGAEIALRLGIAGVPAIDLSLASAGSIFGLAMADTLAAVYGNVLVVASERMSEVAHREPLNRNVAILFGDGAGAGVVSATGGRAKILGSVLHTDGTFAGDLALPLDGALEMNGQVVIRHSLQKFPAVIREVLEKTGCAAADAEVFLMHQANRNLMVRVAQAVGAAEESFYSNIARYGNTSSASLLIAAAEWWPRHALQAGRLAVFAGFGAGFHWGALVSAAV